MNKKITSILALINILIPIILFIILLFTKLGESALYYIALSLIIGWAIPYFVLIITGISMYNINHPKLSFAFNSFNILLIIVLIFFIIKLYSKELLIFLIENIVILIISLINLIYFILYIKRNPDIESKRIKKIKEENNGAIV